MQGEIFGSPRKPFIRATINPYYDPDQNVNTSELVTETYANTGLMIQNGSILIMLCLAYYPVKWFNEDDTVFVTISVMLCVVKYFAFMFQETTRTNFDIQSIA